jgi:RNA polymerase sigma-B factor
MAAASTAQMDHSPARLGSGGTDVRRRFALAHGGDAAAREELVLRFLPLARRLARRYQRSSEPFDDLLQVATLGLVKAVDRFDPDRGVAFTSFAVPTILGELKRHFRNTGWAVHVPRGLHEQALRVDSAHRELESRLGRAPRVQEVADTVGISLEEVLSAMEASAAYEAVSIDAPVRGEDGEHVGLAGTLGNEDPGLELAEHRVTVAATVRLLPRRDREVLELRFGQDLTQSEIAARIGVSQMQVSRIIRRALERLRALAGEDDPDPDPGPG